MAQQVVKKENPRKCIAVCPRGGGEPLRIFVAHKSGVHAKTVRWIIRNKKLIPEDARDELEGWLMLNEEVDMSGCEGTSLIPHFMDKLAILKVKIAFEVHVGVPLSYWDNKW